MMDLGKLKGIKMSEKTSLHIGVCAVVITALGCLTYYYDNQNKAIKSNIESAIVKGIDPVAVRCSYSSERDNICLAYAMTHGKVDAPAIKK
jgi:hypothetical protein